MNILFIIQINVDVGYRLFAISNRDCYDQWAQNASCILENEFNTFDSEIYFYFLRGTFIRCDDSVFAQHYCFTRATFAQPTVSS